MCKGRTHHAKVRDFQSGFNTTNELNIFSAISVKQESKNYYIDKTY